MATTLTGGHGAAFLESVRPVLFESGIEEYPYGGIGSSFFVAKGSEVFWITANHVIQNQEGATDQLRIFPTDGARISIPYNALFRPQQNVKAEEHLDFYILRVDQELFKVDGDAPLTSQDLLHGTVAPVNLPANGPLLIVGYPAVGRTVDYEEFKIKYQRSVLPAVYLGPGIGSHCYKLRITDTRGLESLNGLGGGPVFHIRESHGFGFPLLVGMMIRATASSRIGHFIGVEVLDRALDLATAS
jgi:hypothetical protein